MNLQASYNLKRALVDIAADALCRWVGEGASRQEASAALAYWRLSESLDDELRAMVLERFEPDRQPVPGVDYLPEPTVAVARLAESGDGWHV